MRRAPLFAAAVLTTFIAPVAWAQSSSGALQGTVRDETAAVISGASVAVSGSRMIGGERNVQADATGRFRLTELPPGLYAVSVSHPGFTTARRDRIELQAGGTTVVDFTLAVGPVSDTVQIVAPSPMVDVTSAAPNQNVSEAFVRELPTSRVATSLINMVPGVLKDVAFGGTQGSNAISADGLDLTEAARQEPWLRFDQNWVQEVQVNSLGAGASAGGFTGLAANLVLKSGSNSLTGLGEFWWTRPSWVANNIENLPKAQQGSFGSGKFLRSWDASAQVGFPLMRDRLWAFAGYRRSTLDSRPAGFSGSAVSQTRDSLYLVKVTSAPLKRTRLEWFVQVGRQRQAAANLASSVDDTALLDVTHPQVSWNLRATWTPLDKTLVEARYGGFDASSNIVSHLPNTCDGPAPHYDITTGRSSGNYEMCWPTTQRRHASALSLTHTIGGLAGTHELRAGVEFDRTHRTDAYNYPGGVYYYDKGGAPYQAILWQGGSATTDTGRVGSYFSDRWQIASRLTLLPGVRVDFGDGSIPGHQGIFSTTAVSPRFGVAFDVGRDHRTVLRAHVGRYVDPVFAQRIADVDYSNWSPQITVQVVGPGQFVEVSRTSQSKNTAIDPAIRHSRVDELIIGAERQIATRMSVQVQYIRRRFSNFMGFVDIGSQWSAVTKSDPGPDGVAGTADDAGPMTSFALLNPGHVSLLYTNPPDARRRYDAVQVVARSAATRLGQFQASYTWSRSEGNVGNQLSTSAGLQELGSPGNFVNPNWHINAYGRLAFDPTHEVKVLGTSRIALWGGLTVSAVYRYASGDPWGRRVMVLGLPQGVVRIRVEPRGARRLQPTSLLDLRVDQAWRIPGRGRLGLFLDVFNLANRGVATSVADTSGPVFGWPSTWTDPRTLHAGLRFTF